MSAQRRHTVPVDVHLLLRRDGARGPEVLLSRRAGPVYASGMWHLPSGHPEADEDFVRAVIREAREETGIIIDAADVRAVVTVHHRPPTGSSSRLGVFFEVRGWSGRPGGQDNLRRTVRRLDAGYHVVVEDILKLSGTNSQYL
ncbi:NUDIX domain-containing protein [Streptomyces sp. NRRL F-2664]|uniref:NUDIX domain-containing protein n=1 Tax=Streptomyces sp. NRRL F-2664 TaxID=1463842 RepID=UPI00068FD66B|nr:NUDIX domain-containing protein [Streptomyces sp. NRRL F-2664]